MGGMRIGHLQAHIEHLMQFNAPPKYLILHCGGNDICAYGYTMVSAILDCKNAITEIQTKMPQTMIIWSQILPRLSWRNHPDNRVVNRTRVRVNSCLSTFVIKNGGAYVRYFDIVEDSQLFKPDDTHLSTIGTEIMLNTLSAGISYFLEKRGPVYPPNNRLNDM